MKRRTYRKLWNRVYHKVFNSCRMNPQDLNTTCTLIRKHKKAIQLLRSYHLTKEKDFRSGYETYGYDSLDNIESNLLYISDRFHAAFRLSWLVNVPDEVDKLCDT